HGGGRGHRRLGQGRAPPRRGRRPPRPRPHALPPLSRGEGRHLPGRGPRGHHPRPRTQLRQRSLQAHGAGHGRLRGGRRDGRARPHPPHLARPRLRRPPRLRGPGRDPRRRRPRQTSGRRV
ncbi:MAG: hypothetical protein AVDCRST_MAG15-2633, partial [uncultured Rubellimicrobium sp.]